MTGNELDAESLQPDHLMATIKMVEWMKLNLEVSKLREENAALRADCARISAECGLPPTMAPADGEVAKVFARAKKAEAAAKDVTEAFMLLLEDAKQLRAEVAKLKAAKP